MTISSIAIGDAVRVPSDRQDAFLRLIADNRVRLRKVCRVYARGTHDREDLYQDILVQLWRVFPTFRGEASASTWLYRVALNTALGRVRKRRPGATAGLEEAESATMTDGSHPGAHVEALDQVQRLYVAMTR